MASSSLLILHPRLTTTLRPFSVIITNTRHHFSSSSLSPRAARSGSVSAPPPLDYAQKIDVNPPKGTRDFPPEEMRLRNWLFNNFKEVSLLFGFEEVDYPVLETEALYIRKAGEEIRDQLYCFEDRGNRRVALRPELTPSLARLVIQKGYRCQNLIFLFCSENLYPFQVPIKWFAIGQCWRYERMTRGRRREHYQWNMDIIGVPDVTVYIRKTDSLEPSLMLLMLPIKAACKVGWFPDGDIKNDLLLMAKEVSNGFSHTNTMIIEPSYAHSRISDIISRFYPRMNVEHILTSFEVKAGYGNFIADFHISQSMAPPPFENLWLLVARTDNMDTAACIASPSNVEVRDHNSHQTWQK